MNKKRLFLTLLTGLFALTATEKANAQLTSPAPYCDASFDDMQGFPVDDHINSVSFGTLSNASNAQFAAPHYVHYNNLATATFVPGNTYTLNLSFTVAGGCGYGVWIDYNYNFQFDANELVAGTSGTNYLSLGTATVNQSITIPANIANGTTRMRIRIVEDDNHNMTSTSELPCNASNSATDVMDWGETEDYTIRIQNTSAIEDITSNAVSIYPNPATDQIHVTTANATTYYIQTITGQTVLTGILNNNQIDLNALNAGNYILFAQDKNGKTYSSYFVKQ